MVSASSVSISTLASSSVHFAVPPKTASFHSQPNCVWFRRPRTISASCATATERPTFTSSSSSAPSLYEVLGIKMGATCQEIKTAYRKLARVLHPDVASKDTSTDEFIRLHEAYATLLDPEKRADYDRTLFRRRRPASSFAMSATGSPSAMAGSSASGFSGYTRRNWDSDQCW